MKNLKRALSRREAQILALTVDGWSNQQIAEQLGMARPTVKAYLNRLFLRYDIDGGIKRVRLAMLFYKPEYSADFIAPTFAPKQIEVSAMVAAGMTNSQIAKLTGTTEHVIKNYLRVLYDIAGVDNRVEFALWWANHSEQVRERSRNKVVPIKAGKRVRKHASARPSMSCVPNGADNQAAGQGNPIKPSEQRSHFIFGKGRSVYQIDIAEPLRSYQT